jgi:DNA-binding NarL/FixJ family response regulator
MILVASTATASEALALADVSPVHVAIVDYELAGQNGLTLARTLSKLTQAPRILIYTAYADATMTLAAIVAGADGLLSKASFGEFFGAVDALSRACWTREASQHAGVPRQPSTVSAGGTLSCCGYSPRAKWCE